jgi:protein-tyrosine phosphatase
LKGDPIAAVAQRWLERYFNDTEFEEGKRNQTIDRQGDYFVPILSPEELNTLREISLDEWSQQYLPDLQIFDLGIGRRGSDCFVVFYAPRLQKFRNQHNFPPLDLVIPLGGSASCQNLGQDQEQERRDVTSLWYRGSSPVFYLRALEKILTAPANPSVRRYLHYEALMQHLISSGYLLGTYFQAKELMRKAQSNEVSSAATKTATPEENLQRVYELCEAVVGRPSCLKLPPSHDRDGSEEEEDDRSGSSEGRDYGKLVTQILNLNVQHPSLGSHRVRRHYRSTVAFDSVSQTEGYLIQYTDLPRNFSVICDSVYGSSLPTTPEQLAAWTAMGITNIITVMEAPLPESLLHSDASGDLNFHHFSVPDRHPPTLDQIRSMMTLFGSLLHPSQPHKAKKQVVVHCLGGAGRTAAVLCCYLMRYQGMSREAAQRHLTSTRKTILTPPQEATLQRYYQECLSSPARPHPPAGGANSSLLSTSPPCSCVWAIRAVASRPSLRRW